MKFAKYPVLLFIIFIHVHAFGQDSEQEPGGFNFTITNEVTGSSVKDQYLSGTCWSFSGMGLVEAEMIRMGKEPVDISEMYVVRMCYEEKAMNYVRMHGECTFSEGGAIDDVIKVYKKYGLMPEKLYQGLNYGEEKHNHNELEAVLKEYLDGVIKNKNGRLSTAWFEGYKGILDAYLGKVPEKFTFQGKEYTPKTFAQERVGMNPDEYLFFTSFTHHPYYTEFVVEIPDNWSWERYMNVTIDDMTTIIDNAIKNGYAVVWGTDVTETTLVKTNDGIAVVPEEDFEVLSKIERLNWDSMTDKERISLIHSYSEPLPEKQITPLMRQQAFDNYKTTDDHGMLITGIAEDQYGKEYYYVKNSWGKGYNDYDGYMYVSKAYAQYKTILWGVHKNGVPKDILKKCGY